MQSAAATVEAYLAELPADRREVISAVRRVILDNLDAEYEEGMQYGMIGYYVPHRVYPAGYHCNPKTPLPFAGLAAQKNYFSIYLMGLYGSSAQERWFRDAWARTGKKLDLGKCCVRFKRLEDVALEVVGETIRRMPARSYIEYYEKMLATPRPKQSAKKSSSSDAKKPASKKPASKESASKKRAAIKPAVVKRPGGKPGAAQAAAKKRAAKKASPGSAKKSAKKTAKKK